LTAVRDEYGCCQGVIIPLGQNYQHGDTVEITVSGSSQGAVPRMWMTNWDDYANYSYHGLSYTNVISSEEFQFGVAHELEVYCDGANCIVLEYGLGDTGFDRLTIGSIIIAEGITSVPDVTPAPTTAPEWKEPYILLHDSNEAVYTLSNSVEYSEDGKAYVVLNHKDSGYGIGYYFKEDCSSINLNDYKIVVNISSESEFNVIFGTYNELKNDYWDYLINSTLGNQTYSYCDVGENEYEFEWNNDAKIFFMKLNNWVSNNEQGLSEDVKFTINSIKLVKK